MNNFKIISKWTVISIIITIAAIYLTGNGYFLKALVSVYGKGYTTAYLNDYTVFDNQTIHNGTPKPWPKHKFYNKIGIDLSFHLLEKLSRPKLGREQNLLMVGLE